MCQICKSFKCIWNARGIEVIVGKIESLEMRELVEATIRIEGAIELATTEVKPDHVTRQLITRHPIPQTTIRCTLVP